MWPIPGSVAGESEFLWDRSWCWEAVHVGRLEWETRLRHLTLRLISWTVAQQVSKLKIEVKNGSLDVDLDVGFFESLSSHDSLILLGFGLIYRRLGAC